MNFLYNIAVLITQFLLKIVAKFNEKINLFVEGRKGTFKKLSQQIQKSDAVIWFHCASLGEFEQGRPIIEQIKKTHSNYKIVLTFFSPSGYEVQKNYAFADVVTYLPLDTKSNAKKFLNHIHPTIAVFVKYEFWPNILNELQTRNIETILVSGIFRKDQAFFQFYGGWMRKSLHAFSHFFVQNENSEKLLKKVGYQNVTLCGDTRFDRVFEITKQNNQLDFIENFIQNQTVLVAGSTWPKDEELLVNYINNHANQDQKFIIAPHHIADKRIATLQSSLQKKSVKFSDKVKDNNAQVFIADTIGILTKIYSYADIAYVGGGFGAEGVHNVLEPATFGAPIVIGPIYDKFEEAKDLVRLKGAVVVNNQKELNDYLNRVFKDEDLRKQQGNIAKKYITKHTGATTIITNYMAQKLMKND